MSKTDTIRIPTPLSLVALSIIGINSMLISSMAVAEDITLETVVITGEKINKSLKDTTTAVTVITEESLESGETKQTKDIATQAPNVVTDSFGNISIRGMSGGGAATGGLASITGSRARIATVIDGSTQDWSGYNFTPSSLWDVKQVEVLRGPQSTTQGASAIAGALVVTTNDPTFEDEAAIRVGLERYKNGNLKHNLAVMSSGALIDHELAYRLTVDDTKGEGWLNYDSNDYNTPNLSDSESFNMRGKLLWKPTSIPELSAKLTINHHKNDGEQTRFASNTDEGIATQTLTLASNTISRVQDSTENAVALDVDYQLSSGVTNSLHINQSDSDLYADAYSVATAVNTYDIQQKTTSLENRIVFNRDNADLTGVLGFFVSDKDSVIDADQGALTIDTSYTTITTAIYGEGTYALSPKTKAIAGLRVENEDVDKTGSFFGRSDVEQDTNNTYYLPRLGITHAISNATTLGASVRKGYSPSGTGINTSNNAVYNYESEKVTSFELSSKSHFNDGTTLNANVFYNRYTDYQAAEGFTVVNVDEAHILGMELEAATWVTDSLELRGSVGLLGSKIDKNTSNEGNKLSSAPKSNLGLGFTQYIGDAWSFGADITYVDEYYSDLGNTNNATVGGYVITDARAQYTMGNFTINGYIKNLTDEDAVYYRSGVLASVGQTRTIGISALYRL